MNFIKKFIIITLLRFHCYTRLIGSNHINHLVFSDNIYIVKEAASLEQAVIFLTAIDAKIADPESVKYFLWQN